ncbi:MAG: cupin domain-containing protein [Gammaproteobacteria bacterium]|nr:cupin domain-containing protein [Gammaproteobacteria bacterium]
MTYTGGITVHTEDLPWLPLAPKIGIRVLRLNRDTGGFSVMIRAEPGAVLPRHRHVESAEILVLKGQGRHPQTGEFRVGDYVSEPKGAVHDMVPFNDEIVLLMICEGPSEFIADDDSVQNVMDISMLESLVSQAGKPG